MWHINQDQALFLDRDGVINRKIEQGYVLRWSEFEFMPNALSAIAHLSRLFGRIIGVTNQQCVGKRMMLETDLIALLYQMTDCVAQHGGRFDAFYYCPHLAYENCGCRKPAIGMARQAQADYPDIDLKRVHYGRRFGERPTIWSGARVCRRYLYTTKHPAQMPKMPI
ncbi:MAG: HAD-IIIA family hydrolase [Sphingobacteriales bacterium]|nr:HAD-IIIA family hydrolase [Sphingobacteriales bacterium]